MTDESGVFYPGNHEGQMCYGGEADLHKDVAECKKNPSHEPFIPLKDFNKMCLPLRYHDDDLIKSPGRPTDLACCESQNKNKMNDQPGVLCPGNHEAEMCYGGEADLHKHVADCKKNPGHKGFIPLKDFNAICLPSRYHDDDLMSETIKTLAALTVQVKTKFTSLERPEFYPGTQVPYPCYNDRGSHVMRLGTGRVWRLDKYTESDRKTCRCAKCQVSATPSKVWGMVRVVTATHVVFDDSEARQTRCVVGFDDNKSPGVNLDGWEVVGVPNIERDWRELIYVTCDLNLVDELDTMRRRFDVLCGEVDDKYWRFDDVDKLTVIVSHPHGCPKQVSVGQWTHRHERDGWTRYWYTTCTCPGSSGAHVYMLGHVGLFYHHPHSGSNSEGNYGGEWFD
ncbi:uncharacterized protein LOC131943563 isoform X1 [Physella acuta]|uniref:uncharacterized protein LOC131943563 isoform X1 n=1 Tax=Physella acuta TaxID=109671 RepID=UPI0027DE97C3|nr:uncharacterized protein LOC131943563 isoform X1 [Physella acuta]XP_059159729.1 uncharacterized protein LOC131943563 isoform X1 [Physella acuta]XP_059159730.1 uncharacterized protein LOC131943563 isoform X1 [Physella acuta]XP_059159731.1 uncharacterized protein LOC131943563 isoform X1 [Physella acuta]XP_059159734.1 uncharacterized protein LOC131943563 isoform X1 [Physella acuta]